MYVVYGLEDPRDHLIHYVGITNNVYKRFNQHIRGDCGNLAKNGWIFECRQQNIMIRMVELQRVGTLKIAKERERYWIQHYLDLGHPLNNAQIARSIRREHARLERLEEAEQMAKRRLEVMQKRQAEIREIVEQPVNEVAPLIDPIDITVHHSPQPSLALLRPPSPFTSPEIRQQVIVAWNAGCRSCRTISQALRNAGYILGKDTALKIVEDLKKEQMIS